MNAFLLLFLLSLLGHSLDVVVVSRLNDEFDIRDLLRKKRHLLFPDPLKSETKVQVLFGLGLPMESEVSMTLGYVLKCNYRLPYNSTELRQGTYVRYEWDEQSRRSSPTNEIGGISRWSIYRLLERVMEGEAGVDFPRGSGKACLLRAVCESAELPFLRRRHGILGEILHALLTPTTSRDEYEIYSDREYHAAELVGRGSDGRACRYVYPECPKSPLDYFTRILTD